MTLTGDGYIKVAGGCIAYVQGEVKFSPRGGGVLVAVDNERGWFYAEGEHLPSFDADVSAEKAGAFFAGLKEIVEHPRKPEHGPSTRMAEVEIYLPLRGGTLEARWREADNEMDPVLDYINNFVASCAEKDR